MDRDDRRRSGRRHAKVEKFRERSAARVAEIKGALLKWLEPHDGPADNVSIIVPCIEIALERQSRFMTPTAST